MTTIAASSIAVVAVGWACLIVLILIVVLPILRSGGLADRFASFALGDRHLDADREAHYRACDTFAGNGRDRWADDLDEVWPQRRAAA